MMNSSLIILTRQEVECEHPLIISTAGPLVQSVITHLETVSQKVSLYNLNGKLLLGNAIHLLVA